jgi:hypothetical protein
MEQLDAMIEERMKNLPKWWISDFEKPDVERKVKLRSRPVKKKPTRTKKARK